MDSFYLNGFKLDTDSEGWAEISYGSSNESLISFFVLDSLGKLQQLTWDEEKKELFTDWSAADNKCDVYGICGPFGSCNPRNSAICRCVRGFEPKFNEEWEKGNWSTGCLRRSQLNCGRNGTSSIEGKGDWFLKLGSIKLPDFLDWSDAKDATLCEEKCVKNCSCVAYAYVNILGCSFWSRDLIDIQEFSSGGMDMYIRLADSEHDCHEPRSGSSSSQIWVIFSDLKRVIFSDLTRLLKIGSDSSPSQDLGHLLLRSGSSSQI
ncbi:G-type lectin S-receptor-like serine/threonine-protein kinase At1g11330 [Tasmannia lanceolata]|uniref:G-type lectin S-receptor-like serine/threonine-protein kinase At1g11330 n=1 Tax=Tasmannia lanceolata TaxID=3420 RepID=UPI0040630C80